MLIARFSALGDVAMTVPAVYSVCRAYPGTQFTMVTQQVAASLFVGAPANLTVKGVDVKGRYRGPKGMWRLVGELTAERKIDVYIDLHDVIRSRLIGLFCRLRGIAVYRIDKGRKEKRRLTNSHHKQLSPLTPTVERYAQTFRRAGLAFRDTFSSIFPDKADSAQFSEITCPKREGEMWIAIAPFAKHAGKIYPPELMKTAVDKLSARPNTRIFLFGGGGEEKTMLENWASECDNIQSLAGKRYGFSKELALLSHADVMLSMDSANMHLASLVGLPVVSVWGATHPYCGFTGWHQRKGMEVQIDLPCRPCSVFGNKPCKREDYACLRGIPPEMVVARIEQALAENNKNKK